MDGFIRETIGGKQRSFKFDVESTGFILRDFELPMSKIDDALQNPFFSAPIILFHGAKRAMKVEGKEIDITKEDVYNWIDAENGAIGSDSVKRITQSFLETVVSKVTKTKEPVVKKKPTVKKK